MVPILEILYEAPSEDRLHYLLVILKKTSLTLWPHGCDQSIVYALSSFQMGEGTWSSPLAAPPSLH